MLEKRVINFIGRHHVMTLATISPEGLPHCSNLFYAYDKELNIFVFSSSSQTRHVSDFKANPQVAASIVLESKIVGKLQGLQIEGEVGMAQEADRNLYLSKYPYAAVMSDLELWVLRPTLYKLTDNRLGFGKKLIWNKE